MSTRSMVIVKDQWREACIYCHMDGYPGGPHGVLAGLEKAKRYAWEPPRFEADDFAAAIVGAWKPSCVRDTDDYHMQGGNIRIYQPGRPIPGDVEFVYTITKLCSKHRLPKLVVHSLPAMLD